MRKHLILTTHLVMAAATFGCSPSDSGSNPSAYSQGHPSETSVRAPTNLIEAIRQQNLSATKRFMDRGDDINQVNESGSTPLQISLQMRSSDISQMLSARKDLDLGKRDSLGRTAFFIAAQMGETEVLKNLIKLVRSHARWTTDVVDPPTKDRQRALHVAATDEIVQILFNTQDVPIEFDITRQDILGRNAVHTAAFGGRDSVIQWISQEYCDVGRVKSAYEKTRSWSPLNSLQNPLNQRDNEGQTPVILAIKSGSLSATRALMNCPYVLLSVQDKNGMSAIHWAARQNSFSMLDLVMSKVGQMDRELAQKNWAGRLLANSPGSWNTTDKEGNSPLHYAAMNTDYRFYDRVMREFGANPDLANKAGITPKSIFTCRLNKTAGIRNEALDKMCASIH